MMSRWSTVKVLAELDWAEQQVQEAEYTRAFNRIRRLTGDLPDYEAAYTHLQEVRAELLYRNMMAQQARALPIAA